MGCSDGDGLLPGSVDLGGVGNLGRLGWFSEALWVVGVGGVKGSLVFLAHDVAGLVDDSLRTAALAQSGAGTNADADHDTVFVKVKDVAVAHGAVNDDRLRVVLALCDGGSVAVPL